MSLRIGLFAFATLSLGCGGGTEGAAAMAASDSGSATSDVASEVAEPSETGAVAADSAGTDGETAAETGVDLDGDGLDDDYESKLAADYLPFLSVDPADGCKRGIIVFRMRPHPDAPTTRIHVIYDFLLEKDCGASGHVGDDEVFGMTIDPSKPAPDGIVAVRAISHQNTACEKVTDCGSCGTLAKCTTSTRKEKPFPVVFYSKDKHGAYVKESDCDGACFFTNYCSLAPMPTEPKMINAGEPGKPLTSDLTAAGLITTAEGWTEMDLFHFDPWSGKNFGGAGNVASDLDDKAFLTDACK
ncbi:MAG: hypothetical protein ACXVEF_11540 [Polyangiales bacterium]